MSNGGVGMAYTTQQAVDTLNGYLGISEERKEYIGDTKNRGFVLTLDSGEKIVIFIYPLVHKQDNTKIQEIAAHMKEVLPGNMR